MGKQTIEITNGVFHNTFHPTANPIRVIRVGDIFEVDSIDPDGSAKYRAMYGSVMRNVSLDGKYWVALTGITGVTGVAGVTGFINNNESCVACECDIMVLMSVGCKCGWLAEEKKRKGGDL